VRSLRIGEEVLDPGGRRLGQVERIVVDEQAHRVTHVVVADRLVGIHHFRDVNGGRLAVDVDAARLRQHPEAMPEVVGSAGEHWRAPGGYALDDFLRIATALVGQTAYVPPVHADLDLSAVHEIVPGSPVFSGQRHVGNVSQVLTDEDGRVTSLVLRRAGIVGQRHLLGSDHVVEVIGTTVHVDLTPEQIEALPESE
jgi:sporulation protein YlmC with PRC-barrel domain